MSDRPKYHLDENVDPDIARALASCGVDVTTTVGSALRASSDIEQLDFARREGRVLVTHDADFLRLASQGCEHAGIGCCAKSSAQTGRIVRALLVIHQVLTAVEMVGKVEFV